MNGYYAQKTTDEALELAKKTEKQLNETRKILGTLIAWLQMELGDHNAKKLLDDLNLSNDQLSDRHE